MLKKSLFYRIYSWIAKIYGGIYGLRLINILRKLVRPVLVIKLYIIDLKMILKL